MGAGPHLPRRAGPGLGPLCGDHRAAQAAGHALPLQVRGPLSRQYPGREEHGYHQDPPHHQGQPSSRVRGAVSVGVKPQQACFQAPAQPAPPLRGGELGLEFLRLQGALCTLDRSMATRGQGQCASPWSPRTPLTGLTPMSSWGKTAGMASMRLSSAQTAASTGELPLGTRGWWGGGRPGGPAAV